MRYAQRLHIIRSLENFLYQLIALSFFLSPSFLPFACRVLLQFQFSRPREIDPRRSLRFWYILNLCFNFSSIWSHATQGAAQGRTVIIDFVGQATVPSSMRLLLLDFAIISLNMVLISISYETTLHAEMPTDGPDPLLPPADDSHRDSSLVLDLRFSQIVGRLKNPPPPMPQVDVSSSDFLPLPNTTAPWRLPTNGALSLVMGARIRAAARARARARANANENTPERSGEPSNTTERRTIPGGLDSADVA